MFPKVDPNSLNTSDKKQKGKQKFKKSGNAKFKVFKKKPKSKEPKNDLVTSLLQRYNETDPETIAKFNQFPLSPFTLRGLKDSGYTVPTEIQKKTILLSLQGHDILGAAKTGSGKTLAFIIPILEHLFCLKWTKLDGLGALVITPTRELAYQIFETLRNVGRHHDFSAGLIIGGKDLHFEKNRMDHCNIIICTPGRLLQHMDQNPLFNCDNLKILILDEADRCLDMGFEQAMNAIFENLPPRQTLLFSATQTSSVRDLARLSLKDPKYISVHEHEKYRTPQNLKQSYIVCNLEDKVNILWSFIRNHLKHKVLVFMSSCKQVKYMYEVFCRLRPNVSLLALYGSLHQMRRMKIYDEFKRKSNVVLFATDIAARGLDFPAVNWVVQVDCPESAVEYIHRAGRTARYHKDGESLLFLLPTEKKMLEHLEEKRIPIDEIQVNMSKMQNIQRKLEALLARDLELKATAQRAFVSYAKSIFLMKDKSVFKIKDIDFTTYARSLGLAIPPRIRFLQKQQKQQEASRLLKQAQDDAESSESEDDEEEEDDETEKPEVNKGFPVSEYNFRTPYNFHGGSDEEDDNDDENNLFTLKRANHTLENVPNEDLPLIQDMRKGKKPLTKAAIAKKIQRKKITASKKTVFDDEGEAISNPHKERVSELAREYDNEDDSGINIERAKQVLAEEDKLYDKKLFQQKIKAKHKEERRLAKLANKKKNGIDEEEPDQDDEDEYGEDNSDDSEAPDLSWLPDPDKVYSNKHEDSEQEDKEEESEEDNKRKRKLVSKNKKNKINKKRKISQADSNEDEEDDDTPLSLKEDEELVLQLLKNR